MNTKACLTVCVTSCILLLLSIYGCTRSIPTIPVDKPMPPPGAVIQMQKFHIKAILANGKLPFIDMESTLTVEKMEQDFPGALAVMDELGIAQIAFEGNQAPQQLPPVSGYRWSYHVNALNQQYPAYFFLTANGGNNSNWSKQKQDENSYVAQLEMAIRSGHYRLMGELEFRHYMSAAQCRNSQTDRDVTISINSDIAHRVFSLAQNTGIPFVIHYEPEDSLIPDLEQMLSAYPNARVIWAHFGQLRKPDLMTGFTPARVQQLLLDHPNLYFDLSTGEPNRRYHCSTGTYRAFSVLDTVIWQEIKPGIQTSILRRDYRRILIRFSDRFVSAADYGGNRQSFRKHFTGRINNLKLILRDLPDQAVHNIAYRNAWFLLTGERWQE